MNPLQDFKVVAVTPPGAIVDNASWTTAAVDTKGWNYATFLVLLGATDIAMVALKVQESEDNGSTDAYADVPGAVFGGTGVKDIDGAAAALPSATDDNKIEIIEIDLRGRDRYLDLVATAGDGSTGTYLAAVCILSRGDIAPLTCAGRGAEHVLRV